jgi:hypothetical protein
MICVQIVLLFKGIVSRDFLPPFFFIKLISWDPESWVKIILLKNLFSQSYISLSLMLLDTTEEVFFRCGIQRKSFFPLWDTMEKVFIRCGTQRKRFFSVVGYNRELSGWLTNFVPLYPQCRNLSSVVSYTTTKAYPVYCIPLHRSFFCTVSHTGE